MSTESSLADLQDDDTASIKSYGSHKNRPFKDESHKGSAETMEGEEKRDVSKEDLGIEEGEHDRKLSMPGSLSGNNTFFFSSCAQIPKRRAIATRGLWRRTSSSTQTVTMPFWKTLPPTAVPTPATLSSPSWPVTTTRHSGRAGRISDSKLSNLSRISTLRLLSSP